MKAKIALITGAAAGIGRAIATRFAAEGASLVLVDKDAVGVQDLAGTLAAQDTAVEVIVGSVAEEETLRRAVARAEERFGRLDILVNNAYDAVHRPVTELTADEWHYTLEVCLTAVFYGVKHAIPIMQRQRSGAIVNLSSVNSLVAAPGRPAYTAAKGAIAALTLQLAVEYGRDGIRTNAIRPGFTVTEDVERTILVTAAERQAAIESCPMRRLGRPEDIAAAALFLASDEAVYVNGAVLTVDGGASALWPATLVRPSLRQQAGLPPLPLAQE
ncbi:MAG: SDR family oxidoreductase [Ardenticatenaceae bacterium]|nr:SDR family oxidoreductase [Ardenticatenaceae bacterium]